MQRAYTLSSAYKDTLVGGTVITGHEAEMMDIMQELEAGDGKIVTEDAVLQSVLEGYYGADGLVFEVSTVDDETGELKPIETHQPPVPQGTEAVVHPKPPTPTGGMAPDLPAGPGDDSSSGYDGLPLDELRDIASERDIKFAKNATEQDLVQLLEADDDKGVTS